MELAYIIYPDKSREDTRTLHREMIIKHLDLDQRNQLFRELIWAVVIRTPGYRHGKTIGSMISQGQQIRRCF